LSIKSTFIARYRKEDKRQQSAHQNCSEDPIRGELSSIIERFGGNCQSALVEAAPRAGVAPLHGEPPGPPRGIRRGELVPRDKPAGSRRIASPGGKSH
jgi:hypothetical protein